MLVNWGCSYQNNLCKCNKAVSVLPTAWSWFLFCMVIDYTASIFSGHALTILGLSGDTAVALTRRGRGLSSIMQYLKCFFMTTSKLWLPNRMIHHLQLSKIIAFPVRGLLPNDCLNVQFLKDKCSHIDYKIKCLTCYIGKSNTAA